MMLRCSMAVIVVMMLAFGLGCGGPKKFDAAALSAPQQVEAQASSHWKKEGWWSLPKESGKKIVISEFVVQYVTDRADNMSNNQLGLLMAAELAGVGKRKYEFEDGFKAKLPTDLYNTFVKELETAGFTVVPMSQVSQSAALTKITAGEEGARKGMSQGGGLFQSDTKQRGEMYSVPGLSRMYAGVMGLNEAKNIQVQAALMAETGSDIALRVHMIVGLHKGQATVDEGSNLRVYAGLKNWGTESKPNYGSKVNGLLVSTKTIYRTEPVVDDKKFQAGKGNVYQVNEADYRDAVMEIYRPYVAMGVYRLQK